MNRRGGLVGGLANYNRREGMAMAKVMNNFTGQVEDVSFPSYVNSNPQSTPTVSTTPTAYLGTMPAEDGAMVRVVSVPQSVVEQHMIEVIAADRASLVTMVQGQIADLQAHDTVLDAHETALDTLVAGKFDKPTGTTSQYVRGDGTLATLTIPSLTTTSKRANFESLAVLAAHGRTNAATNSPTNSKTDYNLVTTLLGTLTDGLNQTNTAQNTIATNLNALATQFNALLAWLTTNQGSINNLRTAGAAA